MITAKQKQAQRNLEELLRLLGELQQEHYDEANTSLEVSIQVDRKSLKQVFTAYEKLMS